MRTGACTVQQALTAEAASVLKHSLTLARRRGHSQVTPLHVAATLLSSTTPSSSSNLLRRACLKSHPHHLPPSHPLHCRALELCFNVALNRLPTTQPPSSTSLIHPLPSLSNALIAALKRAQAHQRRGCIEQHHQHHHHQQQQQQPLLALKVELEQLIISILDDPSVSRVMREAGFSSTSVKSNLEEDGSSASPPSSSFSFFDSHREAITQGNFWQTHFLRPPIPFEPNSVTTTKEDLRVILEVMLRKQGRRTNSVVVGDSAVSTEGLVSELKGRVERGEVPDELKYAHFIRLQLSYVHVRLMSKTDVDMKVSDIREKISSASGGVIIHAGDLRWAVDEEEREGGDGFRPVDHMVAEIGRMLSELRSSCNGNGGASVSSRIWLVATASYQTYTKCLMRQPSLETQWALQAVVVPSIGLELSLQAHSLDARTTKLNQYPFPMVGSKSFTHMDEEDNFNCCAECTSKYEKEASVFKSETTEVNQGSSQLPCWLQPHKPDNHQKEALLELRRKWNRLCQRLHHARNSQTHLYPPVFNSSLSSKNHLYGSSHPWWTTSSQYHQNKVFMGSRSISFTDASAKPNVGAQMKTRNSNSHEREVPMKWLSEMIFDSPKIAPNQEVKTILALGSPLFSNSTTSKDLQGSLFSNPRELSERLLENIPWQSETIPSIIEALLDCRSRDKGIWLLIQGTDCIGKKRLARVAAESLSGSADRLFHINASKSTGKASSCAETVGEAMRKEPKCVLLIEDMDRAHTDFARELAEGLRNGYLEDESGEEVSLAHGLFILTTSTSKKLEDAGDNPNTVVKMRLRVEEVSNMSGIRDHKRKPEWSSLPEESKMPRTRENELDLNICAEDNGNGEVDDAVFSDLSQEADSEDLRHRQGLLNSIGARFTLDAGPSQSCRLLDSIHSKLQRAFKEVQGDGEGSGCLCIDRAAVEELMAAAGSFLESQFDKWMKEVFQTSLLIVGKGGKVRLSVEGKEGNGLDCGFMGSVLPNRIHVD